MSSPTQPTAPYPWHWAEVLPPHECQDLFDKALASVRRMAQDYAAQQNKALIADLATAIADRDRLESQFRELRAVLQEACLFVGKQALGQSRTHKADALLKLIVDALNATAP